MPDGALLQRCCPIALGAYQVDEEEGPQIKNARP
jgi:hypothetical protein